MMATRGKLGSGGDFRTESERQKWLGTELEKGSTDPTKVDPVLAGLVASGGLTKAELKKLQKSNEKFIKSQYEKLRTGLEKSLTEATEEQLAKAKDDLEKVVRKALSYTESQLEELAARTEGSIASRRKADKKEQDEWAKNQSVRFVALQKTLAHLQKEVEHATEAGNEEDLVRLKKLQDQYNELLQIYQRKGDKDTRAKAKSQEKEIEVLLSQLDNQKAAARVSSTLENSLERAKELQGKLEDRYNKREKTLQDLEATLKGKRQAFKEKVLGSIGVGSFNVLNAINLGHRVSSGLKQTGRSIKDYRDLLYYRRTGKVRGYSQAITPTTNDLANLPAEESANETSAQTQERDTYRRKLLGHIRDLGNKVQKGSLQASAGPKDASASIVEKLLGGLGSMVEGFGKTLSTFGSTLISSVGPAIAVAAAGAVGYKIGEWLNDQPWFKEHVGKPISKGINAAGKLITGKDVDAELKDQSFDLKKSVEEYKKKKAAEKAGTKGLGTRSVTGVIGSPPPPPPSDAGGAQQQKIEKLVAPPSPPSSPASKTPPPPSSQSSPKDLKSAVGTLIRPVGDVDFDGVNSAVGQNFAGMASEYKDATGKMLGVTSAYRSTDKQAMLYEQNLASGSSKKVAKPGTSLHEVGFALDSPSADANKLDSLGLLDKYGFSRPVKREPWHIQPKGITLAAAKSGYFSADYSSDQGGTSAVSPSFSGGGNTTASPEVFAPPVKEEESGDSNTSTDQGVTAPKAGASIGTRIGVNDIPLFSSVDGSLLAMNIGALGK